MTDTGKEEGQTRIGGYSYSDTDFTTGDKIVNLGAVTVPGDNILTTATFRFRNIGVQHIPTLNHWGLVGLVGLFGLTLTLLRRRS